MTANSDDDGLQVLHCNISEEGDPVFSTVFKTEFTTCLMQLTRGSINIQITPL